MHTLKVTLKQHTPLIHFQHDQDGATLRASEVKPKLDRFILTKLGNGNYQEGVKQAKANGWLVGKGEHPALDYKMRIEDEDTNLFSFFTNTKREYTERDEKKDSENKDKSKRKVLRYVRNGDVIENVERNVRYIIRQGDKRYFAKLRKSDSRIIYDLKSYPCFFANMDSDITNSDEYKKITYAENPFDLILNTKHKELYNVLSGQGFLASFFLHHNFGTRQSKGFGSFYLDEEDPLFVQPNSEYNFVIAIDEEYYNEEFISLFQSIELFYRAIRSGINNKNGRDTVFYFKSLAFLYCKNVLKGDWDKKKVKSKFYFEDSDRRKDSLSKQRREYPDDNYHDILFFDVANGYDIRDLFGFSTNEEWQSYKDSIEKKVALCSEDGKFLYPRKDEQLPIDRMRSPLLIKPICSVDEDGNVSYRIYLLFQDENVGLSGMKQQKKICFFSKKEKDEKGFPKRFMLDLPQKFSMQGFFDYIFKESNFDIESYVEPRYQDRDEYFLLRDIFSQLNNHEQ